MKLFKVVMAVAWVLTIWVAINRAMMEVQLYEESRIQIRDTTFIEQQNESIRQKILLRDSN